MLKKFTEHPCKFFSFMLDLEVLVYVLVRRNVSYRTIIFFFETIMWAGKWSPVGDWSPSRAEGKR